MIEESNSVNFLKYQNRFTVDKNIIIYYFIYLLFFIYLFIIKDETKNRAIFIEFRMCNFHWGFS